MALRPLFILDLIVLDLSGVPYEWFCHQCVCLVKFAWYISNQSVSKLDNKSKHDVYVFQPPGKLALLPCQHWYWWLFCCNKLGGLNSSQSIDRHWLLIKYDKIMLGHVGTAASNHCTPIVGEIWVCMYQTCYQRWCLAWINNVFFFILNLVGANLRHLTFKTCLWQSGRWHSSKQTDEMTSVMFADAHGSQWGASLE